jgi:cytochrome c oxidase assembly protein subunit 15
LVVVVVAQGALGYTQYFLGIPPGLVALHVGGAVLVWVATLWTYLGLFSYPLEATDDDASLAGLRESDAVHVPTPAG